MKQTLWALALTLLVPTSALANPQVSGGFGADGDVSKTVVAPAAKPCVEFSASTWRPEPASLMTPVSAPPLFFVSASSSPSCNFDSDCKVKGVVCRNNRCSNAPDGECRLDSECGGEGKRCSSGKCK